MFFRCALFICMAASFFSEAKTEKLLVVTPEVCMVAHHEDSCQTDVTLTWQTDTTQDACLMLGQSPLKCWQNAASGKFRYKAEVQFQTVYSLVNRKTGEQIAVAKIAVQSSHSKTQRRRLRTPWSFF